MADYENQEQSEYTEIPQNGAGNGTENGGQYPQGPYGNDGQYQQEAYGNGEAAGNDGQYQQGPYAGGTGNGYNGPQNGYGPQGQNPYGNGPYNNGPYNNGPYNNGPYNNGPYNNGPYNNGPYNNGPYNNGSYNNGPNQQNPYGGPYNNPYGNQPPKKPKNGFATASLVCGIFAVLSLCCFAFPLSIIMGVGAIAFAVISKKGQPFYGTAIAGIILGAIAVLLGIGEFIYIMAVSSLLKDPENAAIINEFMRQLEQQMEQVQ